MMQYFFMVLGVRFELTTPGASNQCSTPELPKHMTFVSIDYSVGDENPWN